MQIKNSQSSRNTQCVPPHRSGMSVTRCATLITGHVLTTKNRLKANIKYLMVFGARPSCNVAMLAEILAVIITHTRNCRIPFTQLPKASHERYCAIGRKMRRKKAPLVETSVPTCGVDTAICIHEARYARIGYTHRRVSRPCVLRCRRAR